MSKLFVLTMTFGFLWAFPQTDGSADGTDTTAIVGEWKVIGMKTRGKDVTDVSWRGMRYEFKKDSYTMWAGTTTPAGIAGKAPLRGPYSINDETDPRHFNFTMVAGDSRREVEAIYKIHDEKLLLCLGKERPKSFETTDTKNLCYTLERVPAASEK